jgi:hypothetical protein
MTTKRTIKDTTTGPAKGTPGQDYADRVLSEAMRGRRVGWTPSRPSWWRRTRWRGW